MAELRDYQRAAIDDIAARWASGAVRVPVVMATGLGKTFTFSVMIDEWLARAENAGKRALVLVHTNELAAQALAALREIMPKRSIGLVKGTSNQTYAQVIVSSRQTLASVKRRAQLRNVGLIVIDECHHAHARNTYGRILAHFDALPQCEHSREATSVETRACAPCASAGLASVPRARVVGFTATLARSDSASLASVWEDCTFTRDILFGIRNGFLLDVKGERVVVDDLNLRAVARTAGDYRDSALAEELERTFAVEKVASEYARIARDRKGIAFWPLVATAEHAARAFTDAGIPSAYVHGAMDPRERARALDDLRAGRVQVVHNAMVLTEGFDEPSIEAVVIGRPTRSAPLYQQMVGRALRPPRGVPRALWRAAMLIDVTGASDDKGLRSLIDLTPERALTDARDKDPDASLAELDDIMRELEIELESARAGASYEFDSDEYAGATTTIAFDPLARKKAWGETSGGVFYLKSSKHARADSFVFACASLTGARGTFDLVRCSLYGGRDAWAESLSVRGVTLDEALLHGEDYAGDAYNSRKAAYRRRAASERQIALAARYGIDGRMMTGGEISDAIDRAMADRRIDPLVALVQSRMKESGEQ